MSITSTLKVFKLNVVQITSPVTSLILLVSDSYLPQNANTVLQKGFFPLPLLTLRSCQGINLEMI